MKSFGRGPRTLCISAAPFLLSALLEPGMDLENSPFQIGLWDLSFSNSKKWIKFCLMAGADTRRPVPLIYSGCDKLRAQSDTPQLTTLRNGIQNTSSVQLWWQQNTSSILLKYALLRWRALRNDVFLRWGWVDKNHSSIGSLKSWLSKYSHFLFFVGWCETV